MKISKWYMVTNQALSANSTIEGIRLAKNLSVFSGGIVPYEYFAHTPKDRLELIVNRGELLAYQPSEEEIELLYTCYPALIPPDATFKAIPDGIMSYARAWYQVNNNVPYGLAALVDIAGICKRGDVAMAGDIVPASFFAGLSMAQFERLEHYGLFSDKFLEGLAPDVRARVRNEGFVDRVHVDKYQLQSLYKKFVALNPDVKTDSEKKVTKVKETS